MGGRVLQPVAKRSRDNKVKTEIVPYIPRAFGLTHAVETVETVGGCFDWIFTQLKQGVNERGGKLWSWRFPTQLNQGVKETSERDPVPRGLRKKSLNVIYQ